MAIEKDGDNTRVSGDGGSITWGPAQDPDHVGETFISVDTGEHHTTWVTGTDANGNSTLIDPNQK